MHASLGFALACTLTAGVPGGDIEWHGSFEDALVEASRQGRVLFVAVNVDGERGNERTLTEVYSDDRIQELAARTINLIGSVTPHRKGERTCSRFGSVTCQEHRFVEAALRENVLRPDDEGYVVAPQHVFLGPDGGVLLSVPYEVDAAELEWCFVKALQSLGPESDVELSARARPPKRVILGDVHDSSAPGEAATLTRDEALAVIAELKKGWKGWTIARELLQLVTADEPEAREYALGLLRSGLGRVGGGGKGVGGGGRDRRPELLRWIGVASPESYWEVCAEFADSGEDVLRREAVVALEQLASPESIRVLTKFLRRERDPQVAKNLLRAIGAAGEDDKGARKLLLSRAADDDEPLLQKNAVVALGWLTPHEDVIAFLRETLGTASPDVRAAAALAMGLTRDERWVEPLRLLLQDGPDEILKGAVEAALRVLDGGRLAALEPMLRTVAGDEIPRERFFGRRRGR